MLVACQPKPKMISDGKTILAGLRSPSLTLLKQPSCCHGIIRSAQADETRPRQRTLDGHDAPRKENNDTDMSDWALCTKQERSILRPPRRRHHRPEQRSRHAVNIHNLPEPSNTHLDEKSAPFKTFFLVPSVPARVIKDIEHFALINIASAAVDFSTRQFSLSSNTNHPVVHGQPRRRHLDKQTSNPYLDSIKRKTMSFKTNDQTTTSDSYIFPDGLHHARQNCHSRSAELTRQLPPG
ncbi:hypothetical protein EV126DRAFT_185162 [Verticillium dahliae]|nr:hypothetical protein EV126DRAFT_185162 [Verticillium dahliae]